MKDKSGVQEFRSSGVQEFGSSVAIYTLTSTLHDANAIEADTKQFLGSLHLDYTFRGADFSDYGTHALHLIYVRTGGTEGIFRELLPQLRKQSKCPFYLLTSGRSNSLAASMEILSFLRQQQMKGEIIHGTPTYMMSRISLLLQTETARRRIDGARLGIVGEPSDWLISSRYDSKLLKERLGLELVHIGMDELLDILQMGANESEWGVNGNEWDDSCLDANISKALPGAHRIYLALKTLSERHRLQGFTIRCFDLLSTVHNTGCLALARLNAEGYVAGCEGDVPAMLSMLVARSLTGCSGFQANPATIDPEKGELLFAHCTIPLDMVQRYELDTHFESGIGVAIRGFIDSGPVTVFKLSGDLSRHFVAEGQLLRCQANPGLCRTQQVIQLDDATQAAYFLNAPIGNHHIILPGHHRALFEQLLSALE